jgi:YHS domain-containing protein
MKKQILIVFVTLITATIIGQTPSKKIAHYNLENNLAIQGYDPVAYFKSNKAIKGTPTFKTNYQGVTYYFSTNENKEAFIKNPTSFEPQYGGWCAFAMGDSGEKVSVNPQTYKIIDNKLYLFYNAFFSNTLKSWNKDEVNLKKKADLNWKKSNN